jgi:hypothetical protein
MDASIFDVFNRYPSANEIIWTSWIKFPSPQYLREIKGPKGPGIYQVKNVKTDELILFGIGGHCQDRMQSLMPAPYGSGTRNASDKRDYIFENYENLVYRYFATKTREDAANIERGLKSQKNHMFNR